MNFEYEYLENQEEVREHIQNCEGRHTQQAIYSTFHDALTQICYGCLKVRTTIKLKEKYENLPKRRLPERIYA
jgi:hypothetical protein